MQEHYVRVLVPLRLDWIPVYRTELPLKRGDYVNVALSGRNYIGVVWECDAVPDISSGRILPVLSAAEGIPAASEREMKFWTFLSEYYLCSLGEVYKAARPAQLLRAWQAELRRMERTENARLARKETLDSAVARLELRLAALEEKISSPHRSEAVVSGLVSRKERILAQLEEKRKAAAALSGREDIPAPAPAANTGRPLLVHGTQRLQTYLEAVTEALDAGGQVLILTPETAFCERLETFFSQRLGSRLHTVSSPARRGRTAIALQQGAGIAVVSTKNGIFLPFSRLSLIVIDEEQDSLYKQNDSAPRYNGRDAAVLRAKIEGGVCVLGSATPSLETLYNAKKGKYGLSRIAHRIDNCKLPLVHIADMKREKPGTVVSRLLFEKLADRLDKGEQTILFLNRRGYSKIFECPDCGYVEECPHCSVSMTWHKRENTIKCHICGYTAKAPSVCRKCGSPKAKWRGHGTQKLEDIIAAAFPSARVGRMDRDAMKRRDNYRKVLGDFRTGKLDILIGTQMIAKGLDFPRVTLVGIIDADIGLNMPDFRAGEKTYQLVVQVAGRAGRGGGEGEVIIQTMQPEAAPIQYAKRDDMQSFLEEELANREEYSYPPTMRLIRHIFRSRNETKLEFYAEEWAKRAVERFGDICQIRGPAPAPLERSEDFYRWHIWYFCKNVKTVVAEIESLKNGFKFDAEVEDILDVDPMSLM